MKTNHNVLSRRTWLGVIGLSALWLAFILRIGSAHLTLSEGWADAVSHLYSTWIFWDHGLEIEKRPMLEFVQQYTDASLQKTQAKEFEVPPHDLFLYKISDQVTRPVVLVWHQAPRPYPPGLYLWMAAPSWLLKHEVLSFRATLASMLFIWLIIAHFAVVLFWRELLSSSDTKSQRVLATVAAIFFYFEAIRWTLNSQYDLVSVLVLLLAVASYRRGRLFVSLAFISLAVFLHLRAVFYFPFALFVFAAWAKEKYLKGRLDFQARHLLIIILALTFAALAALTMIWNEPYFKMPQFYDLNPLHYSKLGTGNWPKTIALLAGVSALAAYWLRSRNWLAFVSLAWVTFVLLQSRLIREWYVLFLIPMVLLMVDERGRRGRFYASLGFYLLFAALVLNNSPFEFRLFREIADSIQKRF